MPAILGFTRPREGTGAVYYFPGTPEDQPYRPLSFRFKAQPWARKDHLPFNWRLLEPSGEFKYPTLDFAVDRFTEVVPPPPYRRARGPDPSVGSPFVRLYRTQYRDRIPGYGDDERFEPDFIMGNADRVYGTTERHGMLGYEPNLHRFYVHHLPLSNQGDARSRLACIATQIWGLYHMEVRARDIWKPLAYWFEINDEVTSGRIARIKVYADRNTELKNVRTSVAESALGVECMRADENERSLIPTFDESLRRSHGRGLEAKWPGRFVSTPVPRERPEGYYWKRFVFTAEMLVGVIPVIGEAYDAGSIAYMMISGKQPWTGERVTRAEAIAYAALVLGPMSVAQGRALLRGRHPLQKLLKGRTLADDARRMLQGHVDPVLQLHTALIASTPRGLNELQHAIYRAINGELSANNFHNLYANLVKAAREHSTLETRFDVMCDLSRGQDTGLDTLMSAYNKIDRDRQPQLHQFYQNYLNKNSPMAEEANTLLRWMAYVSPSTRPGRIIAKALGKNQNGKLRAVLGDELGPTPADFRRAADAIAGLKPTVAPYNQMSQFASNGLLEGHHIFESQFLRNPLSLFPTFDVEGIAVCVLVPKDRKVGLALREVNPAVSYPFTHADFNALMRETVPTPRAAKVPLQGVFDAHVRCYLELGVKVGPNSPQELGRAIWDDLVFNCDELRDDMLIEVESLRSQARFADAATLEAKAEYVKRWDPKDRAFRGRRFEQMERGNEWWVRPDS